MGARHDAYLSTCVTASTNALGASCGRLWPTPPGSGVRTCRRTSPRTRSDRMGCAIGVTLERDGRYSEVGKRRELPFQFVVLRFTGGKSEAPSVAAHDDVNVIRVVERRGAAIEGGIVELPLRRSRLPDEPVEVRATRVVTRSSAFGGEVVLIPPRELSGRRQRSLVGILTSDEVAAHRDQRLAPRRPERRDDVGAARPPVEAPDDRRVMPSASINAIVSTASADC